MENLKELLQAIESATNLKEKELRANLIGRVIASKDFIEAIQESVKSGIFLDYGYDGENEYSFENYNEIDGTNSVLETLEKYLL
jgi:SAM-dependent MidA family methyltransferase